MPDNDASQKIKDKKEPEPQKDIGADPQHKSEPTPQGSEDVPHSDAPWDQKNPDAGGSGF